MGPKAVDGNYPFPGKPNCPHRDPSVPNSSELPLSP